MSIWLVAASTRHFELLTVCKGNGWQALMKRKIRYVALEDIKFNYLSSKDHFFDAYHQKVTFFIYLFPTSLGYFLVLNYLPPP